MLSTGNDGTNWKEVKQIWESLQYTRQMTVMSEYCKGEGSEVCAGRMKTGGAAPQAAARGALALSDQNIIT